MKLLILGGQGMLGHKVFQQLSPQFDTYTTFRQPHGRIPLLPVFADPARQLGGVDARHFDTVVEAMAQVQPAVVINAIGIIKQMDAAKDPIASLEVNALFPHKLAKLCLAAGARLIHISTDCVFSGQRGNYSEADLPDPVDLYGRSKLLGEVTRPGCLTVRTSIIGRDFVKKVGLLEWFLGQQGGQVNGFTRAIYTGLTTQALARILGQIIADHPQLEGLYQVASQPISKYDLLVQVRNAMELEIEIAPDADFFCDRSLDGSRFQQVTGIVVPSWETMIADLAADPTPYDAAQKGNTQ